MRTYSRILPVSKSKELKLIDSNLFNTISQLHQIKDYYNVYRIINYFPINDKNKLLSKHHSIDFIICELVNGLYKIYVFEELLFSKYIIIQKEPDYINFTQDIDAEESIIEYPNKRQSVFIIELTDEEIYEDEFVFEDDDNMLLGKIPIIGDNNKKEPKKLTKEDILNRMVYSDGKLKGKGFTVLKENTKFIYETWKL
jgi:hypothetical protein